MDIHSINKQELTEIIEKNKLNPSEELLSAARSVRNKYYGNRIFVRGLIEFTNYCKNNCFYCGIRAGNKNVRRFKQALGGKRTLKKRRGHKKQSSLSQEKCLWPFTI